MMNKCWIGGCVLIVVSTACQPQAVDPCPQVDTQATMPDVAGVFRYAGVRPFLLTGTITFEQDGSTVSVVDTTYDFTGDRRLEGTGNLIGNRLEVLLVPRNGDPDYSAQVTFVFSADGNTFCVQYADTNGDSGDLGTYHGERIPMPG